MQMGQTFSVWGSLEGFGPKQTGKQESAFHKTSLDLKLKKKVIFGNLYLRCLVCHFFKNQPTVLLIGCGTEFAFCSSCCWLLLGSLHSVAT